MQTVKHSRSNLFGLLLAAAAANVTAHAAVVTFNSQSEVAGNFNVDVFNGDSGTQWQAAYAASGSYANSDGGFVHFNYYNTANSLQFKSGPVFLNGFSISSQYAGGGAGVASAATAGRDYVLELYDDSGNLISQRSLLVGASGSWDFVDIGVGDVRTLRLQATGGWAGSNGGWWPNIDNITYNQPAVANRLAVPEPGAVSLVLAALGGLALVRRWRGIA